MYPSISLTGRTQGMKYSTSDSFRAAELLAPADKLADSRDCDRAMARAGPTPVPVPKTPLARCSSVAFTSTHDSCVCFRRRLGRADSRDGKGGRE